MAIVCNSGPILSFARAGRLDLLQAVVRELIVPAAVSEELLAHGAGKPAAEVILRASWIKTRIVQSRFLVAQLPEKLHLGEREAMVLAYELGAVLLVDEREARKEARRLRLEYFGSLRILKEAKDRGIIPTVKPVLDELIRSGTYVARELYKDFLRELEEM